MNGKTMSDNHWLNEIALRNKDLHYKLKIIFGFFFPIPFAAILFLIIKYNIFRDNTFQIVLLTVLACSLYGYWILRNIFTKIVRISEDVSKDITKRISGADCQDGDQINVIANSFRVIENQFQETCSKLERKGTEISTLKELSDLCYVTFDTEELLYITLERALKLVNADVGSVLLLERPSRKNFIVQSTIGLGSMLTAGEKIDFSTSIAKYAVINKTPIVVEDIEKDNRFARSNRSNYATKSFICMPIKTIKDIIGVVTISRRDDSTPFNFEDTEVLTPLLSTAAFTYENLRLTKENEVDAEYLKIVEKVMKNINSSTQEGELINGFLQDVRSLVPFDLAIILIKDEDHPEELFVLDIISQEKTDVIKGSYCPYKGSVIDKVMDQGTTLIIDDLSSLNGGYEKTSLLKQKYNSCLLSALKTENETKGMLALYAHEPGIFHRASDFINIVAGSVALSIAKNKLSTSIKKRKKELDTLTQIGNVLASSTFDIDQVLKYTMDMVRIVMNVEAGSLLLLNNNELEFKVTFNVNFEKIREFKLRFGQGIAGYAATCGKPMIVNDVRQSPHFCSDVDKVTGFTTRSALCVPIISQGKVLGIIELLNKINGDFTSNDEQLLQSIVSSVTIAMENARLYRETVSMTEHERGIRQMFQKFVPKEVVDKIIHGEQTGRTLIDEFKTLTLLNIDIRGFSKLATKIGPRKTVSMLNYFFSTMGGIVFNHHGIVDKYLGDGFLAVFGAPVASPSDADNAVAAALEMKRSIESVSNYFLSKINTPLTIGISIHTGEVVIGNIGFDKKIDYTVIGDPVNTVFRLQGITKSIKNGILISEKTHSNAQSHLNVREVGIYEIDSMLGALKVYELLGIENN
ncbi:MAG: GAF domain-containing protein [Syntrophorhabdaceae bacterium]|nr:GAF domain-containing protein [Syntrophorhabdaceae bacterium]